MPERRAVYTTWRDRRPARLGRQQSGRARWTKQSGRKPEPDVHVICPGRSRSSVVAVADWTSCRGEQSSPARSSPRAARLRAQAAPIRRRVSARSSHLRAAAGPARLGAAAGRLGAAGWAPGLVGGAARRRTRGRGAGPRLSGPARAAGRLGLQLGADLVGRGRPATRGPLWVRLAGGDELGSGSEVPRRRPTADAEGRPPDWRRPVLSSDSGSYHARGAGTRPGCQRVPRGTVSTGISIAAGGS